MTDATITTTSAAPNNPTTAPAPATAAPAPQPAAPRAGSIADAHYDGLSPQEQGNYARIRKGPDGGSEWVHRDQLAKEPAADGKQPGAPVAPGEKVKIGDYELSANDVAMLMQQKAAADLKATQVPAEAFGYEPKLPEGLKLPEGIEFKVDPTEPGFDDLRQLAKKIGLTQAEFSDILAIHASREMANEAMVRTAAQAEVAKLGPNGTMRVTAIDTFVRGLLGDDLGGAMKSMIFTEKHVRGWEKIMQKMGSQGAASFRQDGREPPQNGKGPLSSMSEEQYSATSAQERYRLSRT